MGIADADETPIRLRILTAAIGEFAAAGFAGARIDRIARATHDTHGSSPADRSACPPGLACGGARFPLWAGNDDAFALSLREALFLTPCLRIGISIEASDRSVFRSRGIFANENRGLSSLS